MLLENIKFDDINVKLSPNALEIDDIYPSEFKVCGLVTSTSGQQPKTVEINSESDNDGNNIKMAEAKVDHETGKFCQFLKPGNYNLAVKLTDFEKSSGMQ